MDEPIRCHRIKWREIIRWEGNHCITRRFTIIRNCHPELVSGSMSYRKSEMLKKFQHDTNIAKVSIFDYGLWVYLFPFPRSKLATQN